MATLPSNLQSIVTANSSAYQVPLTHGSIRVMQLHPGLEDEPISCSFDVVELAEAGHFEALSYCWGSVAASKPIFCNGQSFIPTENLYTALKRLRLSSTVRYMWVDAICINQNDILERNQQVPLMRQIYCKADQITVWLGEEDETTALALAMIRNNFESCCSLLYGGATHEDWLAKLENNEDWHSLRADVVMKVSPEWPGDPKTCTDALQTFFQRQWFHRVWVVQEMQGSPHIIVQVGRSTVAWDMVALAATWVVYAASSITRLNEPYKFGGFLHTDLMRQRPLATREDVPFLEVLDRCRAFQCTIDKDRIFALLQYPVARVLPSKHEQEPAKKVLHPLRTDVDQNALHFDLEVDYNMTLFEIYRQIALGSITESHSLQVLSHAVGEPEDRENYPSWMPVWHAKETRHTGPRRTFLYNASRECRPQLRTFEDPMLLGLDGVVVGIVTRTSTNIVLSNRRELHAEGISYGATLSDLREISRLFVRDCWQPEENWLSEAMCRTSSQPTTHFEDFCAFVTGRLQTIPAPVLVSLHGRWCNICLERHRASPADSFDEAIEILHCEECYDFDLCVRCRGLGHGCPDQHELIGRPIASMICDLDEQTRSVLDKQKGEGNASRFDTGARQSFDRRCFVKLDNELIGVAPDTARNGDLVVVFLGSRVPFVLRQHGNNHSILGECYVHGAMDGEAIDSWREGRLAKKAFVLT